MRLLAIQVPTKPEHDEVRDIEERPRRHMAEREVTDERDPVVERREAHDPLDRRRIHRDREERRAEEEHRHEDELDALEVLPVRRNVAAPIPIPAKPKPTTTAAGSASSAHHEWNNPSTTATRMNPNA